MDKSKKIQKLREEIAEHDELYYKGQEIIPDELHDFKVRKLRALGQLESGIGHVSSERQKFKTKHRFPMMSLNNAFNQEELFSLFFNMHKKILKNENSPFPIEYFLEPKIDGISVSLHYQNGNLKEATSRGDGTFGEDWTEQILNLSEIPKKINYPDEVFVRGEIFISKDNFEKIQLNVEGNGQKFINSRSYVSGSLRLKNSKEIQNKQLSFIAYQAIFIKEVQWNTQYSVIKFLRVSGFPTIPDHLLLKSSDTQKILSFLDKFGKVRKDWNIPNDGIVLKVNSLKLHAKIGNTSKFPKWAIAYKYPSLIKETTIERIEATVGRSGRITYLGKLNPVYIDGSWINWVTLHNHENIKMLKLNEGVKVQVYKSGEIIPQIISAKSSNNSIFPLITECPSCKLKLTFREGNKLQYCVNLNCFEREICKVTYFCSKQGIDIEGLSEQTIRNLYREKIIQNLTDLFYLKNKKNNIFNSTYLNIKEKSFHNLILSIERSILSSPEKILTGLGIEYVGKETAKLLLTQFKTIDNVLSSNISEKLKINGVGVKIAYSIDAWWRDASNQELVKQLKIVGFNFSKSNQNVTNQDVSHFLYKKNLVITGAFSISRERIQKILSEKYAVNFKNSISKNIDFLLAGISPGSKINQAKSLNIPILSLDEIEKLIWKNN